MGPAPAASCPVPSSRERRWRRAPARGLRVWSERAGCAGGSQGSRAAGRGVDAATRCRRSYPSLGLPKDRADGTQPPARVGAGPAGSVTGLAPRRPEPEPGGGDPAGGRRKPAVGNGKPCGEIGRVTFRQRLRRGGGPAWRSGASLPRQGPGTRWVAARLPAGVRPRGPGLSTGCRFSPWGRDGMVGMGRRSARRLQVPGADHALGASGVLRGAESAWAQVLARLTPHFYPHVIHKATTFWGKCPTSRHDDVGAVPARAAIASA